MPVTNDRLVQNLLLVPAMPVKKVVMIKNFLIAAALVIASPAFVFSQDVFWSFQSDSATNSTEGLVGTSGTAYIFSDRPYSFEDIDLYFTSSDSAVLLLTGGTTFNEPFNILPDSAFNSSVVTIDGGGASGRFYAVRNSQNGINPAVTAQFNPHYEAGVGPNGAVLLASVDYDIVGEGDATLDFTEDSVAFYNSPSIVLNPSLGSAALTGVSVPEPSSAVLLVLGVAGTVSRRRRSPA